MPGKQAARKPEQPEEGTCHLIFMNLNDTVFLDKQNRKRCRFSNQNFNLASN